MHAAAFIGLSTPGGFNQSYAFDVSDNGSIVAGQIVSTQSGVTTSAYRWAQGGGSMAINTTGGASALSADGAVLTGFGGNSIAWRWTAETGVQGLGVLPGSTTSQSEAISSDGETIVGSSGNDAFRWTAATGMTSIGIGRATGVADNGAIVGYANFGPGVNASGFIWTAAAGQVAITSLAGPTGTSEANAVSDDGVFVVGRTSMPSGGIQGYIWTEAGGMINLGAFDGQTFGNALDVSNDGSRIVGNAQGNTGLRATVWSPDSGWQDLTYVLTASGLNLSGWVLNVAYGISDDGRFVVGYGTHNGLNQAFQAELPTSIPQVQNPYTIPEPSVGFAALAGVGLFCSGRFGRRRILT